MTKPRVGRPPDLDEILRRKAAYDNIGTQEATAEKLGISRRSLRRSLERYDQYVAEGIIAPKPLFTGKINAMKREVLDLPAKGKVRHILLTCIQNNTPLHDTVWANLLALKEHYGAELFISTFTYNKNAFSKWSQKMGAHGGHEAEDIWFDSRAMEYVVDRSIEIAPGLVWCGEQQISPTAERPLSGFESYTGRKSGIFPHTKFAMESVASGKFEPTKLNYTTGTVTQRNYTATKAGRKAEFHHGYGALIASVDHEGRWFVRQLNADNSGVICDLDLMAADGIVTTGHAVEAITWGDIHGDHLSHQMRELCWGDGGILDTLRPRVQFFHDTLDFRARNHHDRDNALLEFEKYLAGKDDVEAELARSKEFLDFSQREWCESVVVDSNHDNALGRWLDEADYRSDPANALFFLEAQLRRYQSVKDREVDFHLVEWAMRRAGCSDQIVFLREDESYIIAPNTGGIEGGMHGHLGPNGSRGTPTGLKKMGRKANIGDKHSAGIYDGLYVAGVLGDLDQGYNSGPSSWSHSNIITYANGKRAIQTIWDGKGWV